MRMNFTNYNSHFLLLIAIIIKVGEILEVIGEGEAKDSINHISNRIINSKIGRIIKREGNIKGDSLGEEEEGWVEG